MHFNTLLVAGLSLFSTSSAYVVDVYSNNDCTGNVRTINVWGNTCARPKPGFSSVMPKEYGAKSQRFSAYSKDNCARRISGPYYADGGGDEFQIGKCIPLLSSGNSLGSWSA